MIFRPCAFLAAPQGMLHTPLVDKRSHAGKHLFRHFMKGQTSLENDVWKGRPNEVCNEKATA
jgi:hypothetical protein